MEENIEKSRKDTIAEIKEKIRKNPKFLHPANKERLEYHEKLKFSSGYEFTCWMQQNWIMKNPADINCEEIEKTIKGSGCKIRKEYLDKCAQKAGFKNNTERVKEWTHKTGRNLPMEFNEECAAWFGDFICENYIIKTFEEPIRTPYGNPGFDWLCKKGEKIDHKGSCLIYGKYGSPHWIFNIMCNNIADWFILSAWDNRDSLNPLHVWIFYRYDIVRGRKFCEFDSFLVTNTPEKLKELEKWEVTDRLDKLKELCNKDRDYEAK
jgi:hypothetical protein